MLLFWAQWTKTVGVLQSYRTNRKTWSFIMQSGSTMFWDDVMRKRGNFCFTTIVLSASIRTDILGESGTLEGLRKHISANTISNFYNSNYSNDVFAEIWKSVVTINAEMWLVSEILTANNFCNTWNTCVQSELWNWLSNSLSYRSYSNEFHILSYHWTRRFNCFIGPDATAHYFLSYFWAPVFVPVKQLPLVILMLLTEMSTCVSHFSAATKTDFCNMIIVTYSVISSQHLQKFTQV